MRLSAIPARRPGRQRVRRGSLSVELIMVFPILLGLLLGMIEFSMILFARQQLTAASREGARVAALGGDLPEVEQSVTRFLGAGRLGDAEIVLTDSAGNSIHTTDVVPSGQPVEVWVRLPTAHAVPDLLRFVGYSIRNEELVARTVMRKE